MLGSKRKIRTKQKSISNKVLNQNQFSNKLSETFNTKKSEKKNVFETKKNPILNEFPPTIEELDGKSN